MTVSEFFLFPSEAGHGQVRNESLCSISLGSPNMMPALLRKLPADLTLGGQGKATDTKEQHCWESQEGQAPALPNQAWWCTPQHSGDRHRASKVQVLSWQRSKSEASLGAMEVSQKGRGVSE